MGIGNNGHIGFNEPSEVFAKGVHKVELDQETIQANKWFFEKEEDVPRAAYTMGINNIFEAKEIVLLVSGKEKAKVLKRALAGPITPIYQRRFCNYIPR